MQMEFDEYYDMVVSLLKKNGEETKPDKEVVFEDYYDGTTPEESARLFLKDWRVGPPSNCVDGGTCHHDCAGNSKEYCYRRQYCAPIGDYKGEW